MGRLGGNPTRCVRAGRPSASGFHGQTGSTGAQASNKSYGAAYGRFHGVLAPNSRYRESVTPHSVRKVEPASADVEADGPDEPGLRAGRRKGLCCTEGRPAMRLKRVFNGPPPSGAGIDVSVCSACGGPMKIIVGMPNHSIEDPTVIGKILSHLEARSCTLSAGSAKRVPAARAPPPGVC